MIIICGFGFTYWMLLQNQAVFGTPIEALIRTSLMMFDLGYESRLYSAPDQVAYYKLVYVIMIFSAIVLCIFIINLMIGKRIRLIQYFRVDGVPLFKDLLSKKLRKTFEYKFAKVSN
jgi:hypothetical protein